jgi:transcriptional regulator with XRE-family HTH domain
MRENRVGLTMRAARRRRLLTQSDVARLAGVSQQAVSALERGYFSAATIGFIRRVAAPLGITVDLALRWNGPELGTLLDARHARIVRNVVGRIDPGWQIVLEYSFNRFGDRGSVDVLAWHERARALLLVEVKSELDSLEAVLRSMDVKLRVVPSLLATERGWRSQCLGSVLVLPDESTARRSVGRMASVFDVALPTRTVGVRTWLTTPQGPLRGVWFLADTTGIRAIRNPGSPGLIRHPRSPAIRVPAAPQRPR